MSKPRMREILENLFIQRMLNVSKLLKVSNLENLFAFEVFANLNRIVTDVGEKNKE